MTECNLSACKNSFQLRKLEPPNGCMSANAVANGWKSASAKSSAPTAACAEIAATRDRRPGPNALADGPPTRLSPLPRQLRRRAGAAALLPARELRARAATAHARGRAARRGDVVRLRPVFPRQAQLRRALRCAAGDHAPQRPAAARRAGDAHAA